MANGILNGGKAKVFGGVAAFLWSALIAVGAYAWGGKSQAANLQGHEETQGHPVMVERVDALQTLLDLKLETISSQLLGMSARLDAHMARTDN